MGFASYRLSLHRHHRRRVTSNENKCICLPQKLRATCKSFNGKAAMANGHCVECVAILKFYLINFGRVLAVLISQMQHSTQWKYSVPFINEFIYTFGLCNVRVCMCVCHMHYAHIYNKINYIITYKCHIVDKSLNSFTLIVECGRYYLVAKICVHCTTPATKWMPPPMRVTKTLNFKNSFLHTHTHIIIQTTTDCVQCSHAAVPICISMHTKCSTIEH